MTRNERSPGPQNPRSSEARVRALEALRNMRAGHSRSRSARMAGTTPRTVVRYVGGALRRGRGGRYIARPTDRLARPVRVLTTEGPKDLVLRGSRVTSTIARHWNAIHRFLGTGDSEPLEPFHGKRVAGYTLETDPDAIERQAHRGELEFEDLYTS